MRGASAPRRSRRSRRTSSEPSPTPAAEHEPDPRPSHARGACAGHRGALRASPPWPRRTSDGPAASHSGSAPPGVQTHRRRRHFGAAPSAPPSDAQAAGPLRAHTLASTTQASHSCAPPAPAPAMSAAHCLGEPRSRTRTRAGRDAGWHLVIAHALLSYLQAHPSTRCSFTSASSSWTAALSRLSSSPRSSSATRSSVATGPSRLPTRCLRGRCGAPTTGRSQRS